MNPVFKFINSMIIALNHLIDSMNMRTVQTIKRSFLFLTFLVCLLGIYAGYTMGVKSAKIKSPPLAEFVNDTFASDIRREQDKGSFSGLLESEIIKESETINSTKVDFFIRERLNTATDGNVINSGKSVSEPHLGEKVYKPESPVDDDRRFNQTDDSRINVLERDISSGDSGNIIIRDNKDTGMPGSDKTDDKKADIRLLEKDKTYRPETIQKDTGIPAQ
jgi:hypothetical protein